MRMQIGSPADGTHMTWLLQSDTYALAACVATFLVSIHPKFTGRERMRDKGST